MVEEYYESYEGYEEYGDSEYHDENGDVAYGDEAAYGEEDSYVEGTSYGAYDDSSDYDEYGSYDADSETLTGFKGENSTKYFIAIILSIVTTVILLITIFSAWYVWEYGVMNEEFGLGVEIEYHEKFRGVHGEGAIVDGEGGRMGVSEDFSWDDEEMKEVYQKDDVKDLYTRIFYLIILALVMSIVLIFMILISSGLLQSKVSPSAMHRNIGLAGSLVTTILTILCVVMLAVQLPDAHEESRIGESFDMGEADGPWKSFMGSDSGSDPENENTTYENDWHPSTGWYMAIVASGLSTASLVLFYQATAGDLAVQSWEEDVPSRRKSSKGKKRKGAGRKKAGGKGRAGAKMRERSGSPQGRGAGKPTCPGCGSGVRFISQYNRHWCDQCQRYVQPRSPATRKRGCPNCGSSTRFVPQYKRHWCDRCQQYVKPGSAAPGPYPGHGAVQTSRYAQSSTYCPVCRKRGEFIPQYGDHYCRSCQAYFKELSG